MRKMKPFSRIACVGTGTVGRSWARTFAQAGRTVALYDVDNSVAREATRLLQAELPQLASRFEWHASLDSALGRADYVQESGPESLAVKRALFQAIDACAGPGMLAGSSTSTLPGSAFLCGLGISSRCLVVHPTNPPHLVPLVELCRSEATSEETFAAVHGLMRECGQCPVDIRQEIFGFALNRLQAALVAEALRLVSAGIISASDLDRVVTDGLGLRWAASGPFETGHYNAPGGYADYMSKFRSSWEGLFAAVGLPTEIDDGLVHRIDVEMRARPGKAGAVAARDELLAALRATQQATRHSQGDE